MGNGQRTRLTGGVLLSAVFLVLLMSTLYVLLGENVVVSRSFTNYTREHYEMKIMKELFLMDYETLSPEQQKSGVQRYNCGEIHYEKQEDKLIVTALSAKNRFEFKIKLAEEQEQILSENDTEGKE